MLRGKMPHTTLSVAYIFQCMDDLSEKSCLLSFLFELYIAGTETKGVKPVLTVKRERNDMPSTSYYEGRHLNMSLKQEAVTRGWCITKAQM